MRVTNRIMTSNMLSNINRNKQRMSVLADQYATGQKIQRPSEDPVVAVRSLKFRTDYSELLQYYEKNLPDAMSWMDASETAMKNVNKLLEEMNGLCNQGTSDTLEVDDRNTIVSTLREYRNQIYEYGNTDYAGRYVFTGYRTDTPLLFSAASNKVEYQIREPLDAKELGQISHVIGGAEYDPAKDADDYAEMAPNVEYAYRFRLSYDQLKNFEGLTYTDSAGNVVTLNGADINTVSVNDENAYNVAGYNAAHAGDTVPAAGKINFIPETGEIILTDAMYETLRNSKNISADYTKDSFKKDELRPEHYFDCNTYDMDASGNRIDSTKTSYTRPTDQKIEYEINYGQKMIVNTMANDSIIHKIGREIDEILNQVNKVSALEEKVAEVEKLLKDENNSLETNKNLEALHEQLKTELAMEKKIMQDKFGKGITTTKEIQKVVSAATADLGSRYKRLQLTEERLANQKIDLSEMIKKNDKVEQEDALINFNSAMLTYNSSLDATSRIITSTLLDFL